MDYSVYIIQDRSKNNNDILEGLAGDTGVGEHFANAAKAGVADLAGADILDAYATTEKLGENGVAIRGEMINSVSIKPSYVKKETLDNGTTQAAKLLVTTITVKGNLFAPSFIEMKSKRIQNKNMARVLAWASLPPNKSATEIQGNDIRGEVNNGGVPIADAKHGYVLTPIIHKPYITGARANGGAADAKSYDKAYYRRVLITVYSNTDTQFRAVLYDNVYVDNYEELYDDKDGNGKFTLVMKCAATSIFDTFVAGPTYHWTPLSVADQVTSVVSKHTKTTNKAVEAFDRVAGTSISKDVEEYTKKIDSVTETADSLKGGDITTDNLLDNVDKQAETWHPTDMQDTIEQADEYKKTYDGLTDEQKATLKNIPGFDKLSTEEKMKYIEKLKDVVPTKTVQDMIAAAADNKKKVAGYKEFYSKLTDDQKGTLANIPGFDSMDVDKKMEFLKTIVAGSKVPGVETMESLQAITDIARELLGNSTDKK